MSLLSSCTASIRALSLLTDEEKIEQKRNERLYLECPNSSLRTFAVITDAPYWATLMSLSLEDNQLSELPSSFALLRSLRNLHLDGNHFTTFPEVLLKIPTLLGLGMQRNQLSTLPEGLEVLIELDHLDLSHNKFTSLPDSFFKLTSLDHLFLEGNQLTTLSSKIAAFSGLEVLEIASNELTCLPEELTTLPKLRRIIVHHNRLQSLPEKLKCFFISWTERTTRENVLANQKLDTQP